MLAQNFQTPAALGIKDAQFEALLKVLGMLERGEIEQDLPHHRLHLSTGAWEWITPSHFNMNYFAGVGGCGTTCCICGWAEYVGRLPALSLISARLQNPGLHELFDPGRTSTVVMENITTAQAAIALRNYLTHGEPRWSEAMAD